MSAGQLKYKATFRSKISATSPTPVDMSMFSLIEVFDNKVQAFTLYLALCRLVQYGAMATRQNKRIWETQRRAQKILSRAHTPAESRKALPWFKKSNVEAHFYLICWDAVAKAIDTLRIGGNGLSTAENVWRRHRARLKDYQDARDYLEHWTERLPGEKHDKWRRSHSQSGSLMTGNMGLVRLEQTYTFGDKEVDIGPVSAELLERISRELKADLIAEVRTLLKDRKTIPDRRRPSA